MKINALLKIVIILFSFALASSTPTLAVNDNLILEATPNMLLGEKKPKASVGAILYTYNDLGETFLLLGQENSNKQGANTYCEVGGSVELNPSSGIPETFLQGIIRECFEESGGVYKLNDAYVMSNAYTYYNVTPKGREEIYIFISAPYYASANDLLASVSKQTAAQYKEKSKFKWIKLESLMTCQTERCQVQDIEKNTDTIELRDFFYKTLQDARVRAILYEIKALNYQKTKASR